MRIKSRRKEGVPIQLDHIYTGDCLEVLKTLPDESVHCCITSPPYYALRDYGVDGQIGREATPKEYISRLTEVFTEVRRVLRSDGTLWLNISDTYAGKGNQGSYVDAKNPKGRNGQAVALNYKVEGCKPKDMIGIPCAIILESNKVQHLNNFRFENHPYPLQSRYHWRPLHQHLSLCPD